VESGEGELPPHLHHLHPPPRHHLLKIQDQREISLPEPPGPLGWCSMPASFDSVPATVRCGYGWPPTSLHSWLW
jgi:hypothetical protein